MNMVTFKFKIKIILWCCSFCCSLIGEYSCMATAFSRYVPTSTRSKLWPKVSLPPAPSSSSQLSLFISYKNNCNKNKDIESSSTHPTNNRKNNNNDDDDTNSKNNVLNPLLVSEVDVLHNKRTPLVYNSQLQRFVPKPKPKPASTTADIHRRNNLADFACNNPLTNSLSALLPYLSAAFVPHGVNSSYINYMRWRICQRFVNANLHVIGTQSLLLGLGFKKSSLGLSAVLNWVLKDALGKLARMVWASKMGRRFDSDAKRWRFRSSILFALGNYLEIVTFMFPQLFLLFATCANCCKQVAMLTSSSTRTALYNAFRENSNMQNIGDITAKGEAQVAIVDLIGIASGIFLSRSIIGTSVRNVLAAYCFLQTLEIWSMYHEIRSVQFRVLNFERLVHVVQEFCFQVNQHQQNCTVDMQQDHHEEHKQGTGTDTGTNSALLFNHRQVNGISSFVAGKHDMNFKSTSPQISNDHNNRSNDNDNYNHDHDIVHHVFTETGLADDNNNITIPSPSDMARTERIFLPPRHLTRKALAFGSLGRARLTPNELKQVMQIFQHEQFLLIVGKNAKKRRAKSQRIEEHCHIVLHVNASNTDIVKSTLALTLLRQKLLQVTNENTIDNLRTIDCIDILHKSCIEANTLFPVLLQSLANQNWESPAQFMFGKVHMRADWEQ